MSLVEIQDVQKRYKTSGQTVVAVQPTRRQIAAGEFVAVCGPSGCGKSTLLLITGGLLRPDSGHVCVDGTQLYDLAPAQRASFRARQIGFVFQQFHLVPYLSLLDNVMVPSVASGIANPRNRALELIEQVGLADRIDHTPGELSTGERQRTALARALFNKPRLLLT